MEKRNCSGDLGYCEHVGHTAAVILTWSDNTVVDVDCSYQTCGHASQQSFAFFFSFIALTFFSADILYILVGA